jgi:hypothetical protein
MRAWRIGALLALGLLCACGASYYATGADAATTDGLRRVRFSPLDAEFVRPGASLRAYRGVILDPVTVAWKPAQGRRLDPLATPHEPPPELADAIARYCGESLADALAEGGAFALVSEPGWGVLRVKAHVVDLVLTADPEPQERPSVDEYTKSFGALTLVLDVSDARSGKTLLRTIDRQALTYGSLRVVRRSDAVVQASAYRELFTHQAISLRQLLEQLQRQSAPAGE